MTKNPVRPDNVKQDVSYAKIRLARMARVYGWKVVSR